MPANPLPTLSHPLPTLSQSSPNSLPPSPTLSQPSPTLSQPSPTLSQRSSNPLPTLSYPLPTLSHLLPTLSQPSPTLSQPRPNPLPTLSHPVLPSPNPLPPSPNPLPPSPNPLPTLSHPHPTLFHPFPTLSQPLVCLPLLQEAFVDLDGYYINDDGNEAFCEAMQRRPMSSCVNTFSLRLCISAVTDHGVALLLQHLPDFRIPVLRQIFLFQLCFRVPLRKGPSTTMVHPLSLIAVLLDTGCSVRSSRSASPDKAGAPTQCGWPADPCWSLSFTFAGPLNPLLGQRYLSPDGVPVVLKTAQTNPPPPPTPMHRTAQTISITVRTSL